MTDSRTSDVLGRLEQEAMDSIAIDSNACLDPSKLLALVEVARAAISWRDSPRCEDGVDFTASRLLQAVSALEEL